MYRSLMTAGLLSLGLGTAAFAQTSAAEGFQPPGEWNATIAGAMFSDVTTGSVRSAEEITSNFMALSPEDQATVRETCGKFSPAAAGATNAPMAEQTDNSSVREACDTAGKL